MDSSTFGRLSGELRNVIYELVLRERDVIVIPSPARDKAIWLGHIIDAGGTQAFPRAPALAQVCRKMRSECLSVFFGANVFWFNQQPFTYSAEGAIHENSMLRFLDVIGASNALSVRNVSYALPRFDEWQKHTSCHAIRLLRNAKPRLHPDVRVEICFKAAYKGSISGTDTTVQFRLPMDDYYKALQLLLDVWQREKKFVCSELELSENILAHTFARPNGLDERIGEIMRWILRCLAPADAAKDRRAV